MKFYVKKKIIKYIIFILIISGFHFINTSSIVYAAPAPWIDNGTQYIITNRESHKVLNVNFGTDANGTNVTQYLQDGSVEQKFKPIYNSTSDSYKIYAMCSSNGNNSVIDVLRTNGSANGSMQTM